MGLPSDPPSSVGSSDPPAGERGSRMHSQYRAEEESDAGRDGATG
jgi:hypothetical protein